MECTINTKIKSKRSTLCGKMKVNTIKVVLGFKRRNGIAFP
jgi:hypothetical protein